MLTSQTQASGVHFSTVAARFIAAVRWIGNVENVDLACFLARSSTIFHRLLVQIFDQFPQRHLLGGIKAR